MNTIETLEVKYETAPHIPPPYAYYYHLTGSVRPDGVRVKLIWVYHNREELSDEEITDEGFTGEDDFAWEGRLHPVWIRLFSEQIARTQIAAVSRDKDPFMEISAAAGGKTTFSGKPQNLKSWDYFMQECLQAIYEASGREAPLQLQYKKVLPDFSAVHIILQVAFLPHTVTARIQQSGRSPREISVSWEATRKALEKIYQLNYEAEDAGTKEPRQPGSYLETGDGVWYQIGQNVFDTNVNSTNLDTIERFFAQLSGQ